jgi:uncharacterized protein YycO
MFAKLINALLAALGIVPDKKKAFRTDGNAAFLEAVKIPGTVCLIGGDGFISNGIQGAENSFWSHCFGTVDDQGSIIEAEAEGIQKNNIEKYLKPENQIVAYQYFMITDQQKKIVDWAMAQIGKPYGYLEFLEELFPDPSKISPKDFGYICSALWACAYRQADISIIKPEINPRVATPKDINDFLEPNLQWKQYRYNW